MKTKYYIFKRVKNDYELKMDPLRNSDFQELAFPSNPKVVRANRGFDSIEDAENWLIENGPNPAEFIFIPICS